MIRLHAPKGGQGLTTIAAALAAQMANRDHDVHVSCEGDMDEMDDLLGVLGLAATDDIDVETDFGRGRVHLHLRHDNPDIAIDHHQQPGQILVMRPCYLAIRRACQRRHTPLGIILIDEPGRVLRPIDVECAVGASVIIKIQLDPAVARAVDAGMLAVRAPQRLSRLLTAVQNITPL